MTASEHELEPFVGNRSLFHVLFSSLLLMLKQHLQHNLFACKRVFTAQAINGLVPGCRSYPRARIMGNAIDRPAFKGHEQRMVVGDERRSWNDARAASEVLKDLGFKIQAVP